jgi:hypothetical protein
LVLIHVYRTRQLEPLLVRLPRTSAKITMREGAERFAANMSSKLLVLTVDSAVIGLAGTLANLTMAVVEPHLINAEISPRRRCVEAYRPSCPVRLAQSE